jgi:hypothetical protein
MRAIAIIILTIFIASTLCVPTSASEMSVTVQGEQVHARFDLSLVQNVTGLPTLTTTVGSGSQSNLSAAFTQALKNADPRANPSGISFGITSTKQMLNLTGAMDISGVSARRGDILAVNTTWLTFDVTSDLRAQNFSFNTIGSRYLRPTVAFYANASRFVGRPNSTITGVTIFVNRTSISPQTAESYVGNFTMLNFGALSPILEQWNRTYTFANNTTTWRYSPPVLLSFDMRIQRKNVTTDYTAAYGYSALISVSGVGRGRGHTILVDVGTGQTESVMAALVILVVVSAVGIQVMFRNRKKKLGKFQRR